MVCNIGKIDGYRCQKEKKVRGAAKDVGGGKRRVVRIRVEGGEDSGGRR